jgi:hypothetical protein
MGPYLKKPHTILLALNLNAVAVSVIVRRRDHRRDRRHRKRLFDSAESRFENLLFLHELLVVADMLPATTATPAINGTRRLNARRAWLDQFNQFANPKVFAFFGDANFREITRSGSGDEHNGTIEATDTAAAMVRETFNFNLRN